MGEGKKGKDPKKYNRIIWTIRQTGKFHWTSIWGAKTCSNGFSCVLSFSLASEARRQQQRGGEGRPPFESQLFLFLLLYAVFSTVE
jgi:hypothetical protein